MNRARLVRHALVTATLALLVLAAAELPEAIGQGAALPDDLLGKPPFDRITLIDGTVVKVEPIAPRPLPPYDPRKDRKTAEKEAIPREGNIFLPSQKDLIAAAERAKREKDEQINELTIKPVDREGLFRVRRANIKTIEYFEDLLIQEGDEYLRRKDFQRAFERYLAVKERAPGWKTLEDHVRRLLFLEGSNALLENDLERGLRLLKDLHARQADYPGLADVLAKAYSGRIDRAFESGAYVEGRRILHELEQLAPDHALVRAARGRFTARAQGLVEQASRSQDAAERLDALTEALRIWPRLEGAPERFQEAFAALPTLDVAVVDVARSIGPWIRSPADARTTRLLYLPLFSGEDEDALRGRRTDQLAAGLESADLGRRLVITLRDGPRWSGDDTAVSPLDVVRSLADRANPYSPAFQARWANLLERLEPTDDRQAVVILNRAPLKPVSWLMGPIGSARASRDGRVPSAEGTLQVVGSGPFRLDTESSSRTVLRAADPSSPTPVQRLREIRFPDAAAALTALRRGDVTLVEHVAPDQVAALKQDSELQVGRYTLPRLHVLALDGRTPALRNRTLRRGLSYAIDRATILEENLLHRPIDPANGPADGVFDRESYANAPDVKPLEYDPLLARMLVAAARKELGGAPIRLTLEAPEQPEARIAVPKIAEALRNAGIELQVVERSPSELEAELRAGRRFDLAYRILSCVEPITDAGPLVCPGYDAPPEADGLAAIVSPRALELLLQLENAPEFPTARGLVIQFDRETRDELPVIPLWQLQDHYAWRGRLTGPAATAEHLYQGIERWQIAAWFARDPE